MHKVSKLVHTAKCKFYTERIALASSSKELHQIVNTLSNRHLPRILPTIYHSADLPSIFTKHFTNKVEKLIANIASEHVASKLITETTAATFSSFEKVSKLTVKECILISAPISCELDPIPSKLLIECLDSILPSLTDLFNSSLASGIIPQCFKSALVTPILKKRCLDHNDLNNYRPVSNLCFIAKILEKLVLSQDSSYPNSHNLCNTCQSAHRPGHSTEAALLKVVNDLFLSPSKGNISVLALLDFSSALETIDHPILIHRLHADIGFTDTVLQWSSSYMTDRTLTPLYLIIVLLLLLYTQVFLWVQFLALFCQYAQSVVLLNKCLAAGMYTNILSDHCPHLQSCYERMETLQQHAGRQTLVQQHYALRI